ncbi:MAG: endolytic transglycosylase MltG, partial [Deltaproteobacteria bacterium]|nr:endolytic transglycosylase MltG [Deltaproteobacteria bacterium]
DVLEAEGLLRQRELFHLFALMRNGTRQVRAGEYEFSGRMSPSDILGKLIRGEIKGYRITVPEGFTAREILDRLVASKLVDEKEFLRLSRDREFLSTLGIEGRGLEGYLFPETYLLDRSMDTRTIIRTMVNQFWHHVTPSMKKRSADLGLTVDQFVTLASIIEKETGRKEEMPLISAVFHNRLKRRMPLQSDPTVIYGLPDFNGNLRKKDLLKKTPYNTYRFAGLPPGPIASPGMDALQAALQPTDVTYLYFVSKNDGSHHFSDHLSKHSEAVQKYQLRKRKP